MKKLIIILLSLLFSTLVMNAQHTNVMISNQYGCNEPTIIINPKNTDQLYAGANTDNYYYSTDGGITWSSGKLESSQYGVAGDPVLVCDNTGAFYYFHLSSPPSGSWLDRIVCQKVTEAGGAWNDGTYMGLNGTKDQDKEWATVDRTNNNIYVTWTQFDAYGSSAPGDSTNIMFSRSVDGGMSWSEAIRINEVAGDCIDDDNTVEGAVPCVGPDGEIFVSWAGPEGLVFDRSYDGGQSWLNHDIFVDPMPGGWAYEIPGIYRANGMPITSCDTSNGPYHGQIYINWSDQRNGVEDTDVWFVKSTDQGESWSEPLRINNDPPGRQQFFTWMTVDQVTGHIYMVFYDRREYDDNKTDVYMAFSTDGGESFSNFRISDSPFLPLNGTFFGDYSNITAHNNVIRPIWTRLDGSSRTVWTALVDLLNIGIEEFKPVWLSLEQNYPNPFRETTYFSFKLYKSTNVTLQVFDQYGRQVEMIIDHELMRPGAYTRHFDALAHDLPVGLYYFSLTGADKNIRRKMIIMK